MESKEIEMKNKYQPVSPSELKNVVGPRPGCVAFNDVVMFHEHKNGVYPAGIYNRRNVRGSRGPVTARNASLHAAGRAVDIGISNKAEGDKLAAKIIAAADMIGVCEVIWYAKRTTSKGTLPYHGVDLHKTHIHVGFTTDFASRHNTPDLKKWISHFLFGA